MSMFNYLHLIPCGVNTQKCEMRKIYMVSDINSGTQDWVNLCFNPAFGVSAFKDIWKAKPHHQQPDEWKQ